MTIVLGQNYLGLNTDNVSINGNQNVGLYTLQGNSFFPFKNRIINGEFNVNQRNNGLTVNNVVGRTFGPDRWGLGGSTAGAFSVRIANDDLPGAHSLYVIYVNAATSNDIITYNMPVTRTFPYCIEIKSLSSLSIGTSHSYDFFQNIEGRHIMDMDFGNLGIGNSYGQTRYMLLSFFMKPSLSGFYTVRFEAPSPSTFRYRVNVYGYANQWVRYSIPVPIPTSETWSINQSTGLRVNWSLGASSSVSGGTPGLWESTSNVKLSGNIDLVSTLNATMKLTGIQLEYIGNLPSPTPTYLVPSDFQTRSWQTEYELCLRYYQKSYLYGTNAWTSTTEGMYIQSNNSGETTVQTYNHIRWPGGPMRGPPTVTLYGLNSSTAGRGYIWNGSVGGLGDEAAFATAISGTAAMFYISPVTLGNHFMAGFNWVADAEPSS